MIPRSCQVKAWSARSGTSLFYTALISKRFRQAGADFRLDVRRVNV